MFVGYPDNSSATVYQQGSQVSIAPFTDPQQRGHTTGRLLLWHQAQPGSHFPGTGVGNRGRVLNLDFLKPLPQIAPNPAQRV